LNFNKAASFFTIEIALYLIFIVYKLYSFHFEKSSFAARKKLPVGGA
jgi:uncharacterized membrane protein